MKKLLAISATALLVGTLVGCNTEEEPKVDSKPPVSEETVKPLPPADTSSIQTVTAVGEIREVREEEGNKSVLVSGENGDVVFKIQEDTTIEEGVVLEVGNVVSIVHSNMMTRSLPPQTNALIISTVEPAGEEVEMKSVKTTGFIKEIIESEGRKAIRLEGNGTEIIFNIDEKTDFNFALTEGQQVVVEHSNVMTMSFPAQSYAISISPVR